MTKWQMSPNRRERTLPGTVTPSPHKSAYVAPHIAIPRICSEGDTLCQCAVQPASILNLGPQVCFRPRTTDLRGSGKQREGPKADNVHCSKARRGGKDGAT